MRALDFIAGSHTAGAGDAGCVVEGEERVRVIAHGGAFLMCSVGIPNSIDTTCERQLAQWPQYLATLRLLRYIQFDYIVAMPPEPITLGSDDHIGSDWIRAGGGSPGLPINFADTESTGAKGSELMRDAEAGYRNPGLPCGHIDGIAQFGSDRPAIDGQIHRFRLSAISSSAISLLLTTKC
jgi:hypothetical protein